MNSCLIPSLPQTDPDPNDRAARIARDRAVYRISRAYHRLPFPEQVPWKDEFSIHYLAKLAALQGILTTNERLSDIQAWRTSPDGAPLDELRHSLQSAQTQLLNRLWGPPRSVQTPPYTQRIPLQIADYEALFQLIEPPLAQRYWREDWYFAWQRVAGTNPTQLRLVTESVNTLPVSESRYEQIMMGDRLTAAHGEGRLFLAEFPILQGIPSGFSEGWRKYLCAPRALFALDRLRTQLHPVAIQWEGQGGSSPACFTPLDGATWQMAKTVFQVADSNYHGVVLHGTYCHMIVGMVAICTYRTLSSNHPVRILLHPHFQFTVPIHAATQSVFGPGGRTATLQSVSLEGLLELSQRGLDAFNWREQSAPYVFEEAGVLSQETLPDYPYRDDALRHWQAIHDFVAHYIDLYYSSDQDVAEDVEVQQWLRELGAPEGANLRGVGDHHGQVQTLAALTTLVAQIIHRATAYHAAINYSVFADMSFAPSMPAAAYAPPPESGHPYGSDDLLAMLPPRSLALYQIADVFVVGNLRVNTLGQYGCDDFGDRRVLPLIAAFQSELHQIEFEIAARNKSQPAPYNILLPSRVAASIHI